MAVWMAADGSPTTRHNLNDTPSANGLRSVRYEGKMIVEWVKTQAEACSLDDQKTFIYAHYTPKDWKMMTELDLA